MRELSWGYFFLGGRWGGGSCDWSLHPTHYSKKSSNSDRGVLISCFSAAIISSTSGSSGYGFRPSSVSGGYVANSSSCISGVCSVRGGEARSRGSASDYKDTLGKGSSLSAPSKKASR